MTGHVTLGVVDVPELQRREALTLDPRLALHVAVGARGSGKTEAARTFMLALACSPHSEQYEVLVLCDDRAQYESTSQLPLVTAITEISDSERVERFVAYATEEIEPGLARETERHRILIIDSWNAFAQRDEDERNGALVEKIGGVLRNSANVRSSLFVTVDRPGVLPYSMMSSCARPIVLRLDDPDDYRLLNINPNDAPTGATPGRCVSGTHHAQLALVTELPSAATGGHSLYSSQPRCMPVRLLALPRTVSLRGSSPARTEYVPGDDRSARPLGMNAQTFAPISFAQHSSLLITGPPRSGKSTALAAVALASGVGDTVDVLVAPRATPALQVQEWEGHAIGDEPALKLLDELSTALDTGMPVRPIRVFVDDLCDFLDPQIDERLERIMLRSARGDIAVIAAADGARFRQAFGGCASKLRARRTALLLMPELDDGDSVGVTLPRRRLARPRPGYGIFVDQSSMSEILIFNT